MSWASQEMNTQLKFLQFSKHCKKEGVCVVITVETTNSESVTESCARNTCATTAKKTKLDVTSSL